MFTTHQKKKAPTEQCALCDSAKNLYSYTNKIQGLEAVLSDGTALTELIF